MILRCVACAASYAPLAARFQCDCGGLLDAVHDLAALRGRVSRETFDRRRGGETALDRSGVWLFRELVFPEAADRAVSAPEGRTNLYASERLAAWTGIDGLQLKHEGENPTGSFKDRGMTVGVTHARLAGATAVVSASTGNTSSSMAAYAARAGIPGVVLMPAGKGAIPSGKLSQALAYGARTLMVRGDFDAAMALVRQVGVDRSMYVLNSINPFRLEGQKTIVFEAIQQLGWGAPDWIVLPGGNLGNTSAFGKALGELLELGLIARRPRVAVVQAAGANPFYRAFRDGLPDRPTRLEARTIASAIRIGAPVNYSKARRTIRETDGVVEEVTDAELMDAKAQVDAAGIGCEPAAAASVAGAKKLAAAGVIRRGDAVVAVLTGHLLKDQDATIEYHLGRAGPPGAYANPPLEIEPSLDALRARL